LATGQTKAPIEAVANVFEIGKESKDFKAGLTDTEIASTLPV
jgi:hypothetical protein